MKIHTDGACINNPGAGGWAFIVDVNGLEASRIYSITNEQYQISYQALVAQAIKKYNLISDDNEPLPESKIPWVEDISISYSGNSVISTNNKMELTAAMMALMYLDIGLVENEQIDIFTDSKYLLGGVSGWFDQWRVKNWKNSTGKPAKNILLWSCINMLKEIVESKNALKWHWVAGHRLSTRGTRICDVDLLAKNAAAICASDKYLFYNTV